ncbi:MAG: hypothetical protein K2Z81_03185, partial [Cyanobacteria bacterium]|nr:hypothetical protein [Cyanobacteriota bacterium]
MTRADGSVNADVLNFDPAGSDDSSGDNLDEYRTNLRESVVPQRTDEIDAMMESCGFPKVTCDMERSSNEEEDDTELDSAASGEVFCEDDSSPAGADASRVDKLIKLFEKGDTKAKDELVKMGRGALGALEKLADTTEETETYTKAREAIKAIRQSDPVLSKLGSFPRPYDPKTAAGLIKSLDSDSYLERQRAQEYLEEMGPKV